MLYVAIFLFIGRRRVVIKEVKKPPYDNWEPTLVIVNPKSGGNEGVKLLRAFRLLLNPAQVIKIPLPISKCIDKTPKCNYGLWNNVHKI